MKPRLACAGLLVINTLNFFVTGHQIANAQSIPPLSPPTPNDFAPDATTQIPGAELDAELEFETIVVRTRRSENSVDRRSYDISVSSDAATLKAADAIARLPGVITEIDGSLSILGETNIEILVDGQFFPKALALEIPAKQIQRIEVISNPGADARSTSISLNIILRNDVSSPQNLTLTARADSRERYRLSADFSRDQRDWKLLGFVSAEDNLQDSASKTKTEYRILGEFDETGQSVSEFRSRNLPLLGYAVATRVLPNGRTFGVGVGGSYTRFDYSTLDEFAREREGQTIELRDIARDVELSAASASFNLNYLRKFAERDFYRVHALAALSDSSEYRSDGFLIDEAQGTFRRDNAKSGMDIRISFAREVTGDDGKELKFGAELSRTQAREDYIWRTAGAAPIFTPTGSLDRNTNSWTAYASYQVRTGAWTILPGVRAELLRSDFTADGDSRLSAPSFEAVLPSLHIGRSLGELGEVKASVAAKSTLPNFSAFDPTRRASTFDRFVQGDPTLDVGRSLDAEFSYEFEIGDVAFISTLFRRVRDDKIDAYTEYLGNDVFLNRFTNVDEEQAGINLNFKHDVQADLNYAIDLTWAMVEQTWREQQQSRFLSDDTLTAKMNVDYALDKKRSVLLVLQYQSASANLNALASERVSSSLSFVQDLPQNTTLRLELIDFLATPERETTVVRSDFARVSVIREELRGIRATLARRF